VCADFLSCFTTREKRSGRKNLIGKVDNFQICTQDSRGGGGVEGQLIFQIFAVPSVLGVSSSLVVISRLVVMAWVPSGLKAALATPRLCWSAVRMAFSVCGGMSGFSWVGGMRGSGSSMLVAVVRSVLGVGGVPVSMV